MKVKALEHDSVGFGKLFNCVLVLGNVHDGYTGNFSNTIFESFITSGNNVATMLGYTLNQTIVCVGSFMNAGQTFESGITGDLQGHPVLGTKFFQFGHYAIGDTWRSHCIQAIHHGFDEIEFILDGKVDKVGIDEDLIWRCKGGIMFEK